jgi:hypothetical protein
MIKSSNSANKVEVRRSLCLSSCASFISILYIYLLFHPLHNTLITDCPFSSFLKLLSALSPYHHLRH